MAISHFQTDCAFRQDGNHAPLSFPTNAEPPADTEIVYMRPAPGAVGSRRVGRKRLAAYWEVPLVLRQYDRELCWELVCMAVEVEPVEVKVPWTKDELIERDELSSGSQRCGICHARPVADFDVCVKVDRNVCRECCDRLMAKRDE